MTCVARSGEPHLGVEARRHAEKALKVCLAAAVKCNDKASFIPLMNNLPTNVKQTLMRCIQVCSRACVRVSRY